MRWFEPALLREETSSLVVYGAFTRTLIFASFLTSAELTIQMDRQETPECIHVVLGEDFSRSIVAGHEQHRVEHSYSHTLTPL